MSVALLNVHVYVHCFSNGAGPCASLRFRLIDSAHRSRSVTFRFRRCTFTFDLSERLEWLLLEEYIRVN